MINSDPTLDRIREVRCQISAKYDHDPDKLVAHYMELDKTYPPERFFRPHEVGCVPRTTSPAETLDLEQRILTQLHLLSPEQQSSVLGFVERLQGQTAST
jgi:hypothetical protein